MVLGGGRGGWYTGAFEEVARTNRVWLYAGRAVRSFSAAFLTVVFPLYLAVEGYSSSQIGLILTVGGFVNAGVVLGAGIAGDRIGRKPVLATVCGLGAVGGLLLAVGGLLPSATGNLLCVMLANGLCGVGRGGGAGSGGAFGAVFPAEQPLLAASCDAQRRTAVFGRMSLVGVAAGAAGSVVAWLPEAIHNAGWSWPASYRVVFALGAALAVAMIATVVPIRERRVGIGLRQDVPAGSGLSLSTRELVRRLATVNALNGFGYGFLGPLLVYWFHARYGVGPGAVGMLYTVINLITMIPYLFTAPIARRLGAVRTVVLSRCAALAFMLSMIWAPTFLLAGIAYALRMLVNALGLPARQSYVMGLADDRHRSVVAALGMLPAQLTSSVSPVIGGTLMTLVTNTPIVGAFAFQTANVAAYHFSFRNHPPPEEQSASSQLAP